MNINEIKAQEAREAEGERQMTTLERLKHFSDGNYIGELHLNEDIKTVLQDYKLQEQYVNKLEADNEKLRKIINILCDTINQLI